MSQERLQPSSFSRNTHISAVARDLKVPYDTLCCHFLGLHKHPREAHGEQQFLSPTQEQVLMDWIKHISMTGQPLSKRTIQKKAEAIGGRKPSKAWIPAHIL
jgi:hypothetical protein